MNSKQIIITITTTTTAAAEQSRVIVGSQKQKKRVGNLWRESQRERERRKSSNITHKLQAQKTIFYLKLEQTSSLGINYCLSEQIQVKSSLTSQTIGVSHINHFMSFRSIKVYMFNSYYFLLQQPMSV